MKLILLILAFASQPLLVCAQTNPRNLDFETKTGYTEIYPWSISKYYGTPYNVGLDSTVKQEGRYSLHFSPAAAGNGNTDGTVFISTALDIIGTKLKVSAYVKQSNPADSAGFISCVVSQDRGEAKVGGKGRSIIGAADWKLVSFELNIDTFKLPVHHIRLNIGKKGKGELWVDNINIEVDGKNIYKEQSLASSKNEVIDPLTTQQQINLKFLCYTWGFLKYFHPQVAKGNYNWDNELFKIIGEIKNAASDKELSELLSKWITSLGDIPVCNNCNDNIPGKTFTKNIDLEWMKDKRLSKELRDQLQYILANRNKGTGYYVRFRPIGNLEFINEADYVNWRSIGNPNEMFRLLFLFRYWNTVQYFFPYKYIIGKDWNQVLSAFIPRFAEAKDVLPYHLAMSELVNSVNDSHSGIIDMIVRKEMAPFVMPVRVAFIENELVITGYKNDSLGKLSGLQQGDVIKKINGKDIKAIADDRIHLINGSNHHMKLTYLNTYDYITGGKDSIVEVSGIRNGKPFSLTTNRYAQVLGRRTIERDVWRILSNNIGYVHMGRLERKQVDTLFNDLSNTKAIIFDLRHYPNQTVFDICKKLYEQPIAFVQTLMPSLDYPGMFIWKDPINYGLKEGNSNHYKGKVIILVNQNSQSQAEWTAMALRAVPGAITIGSQTSGADGDVSYVALPGGYQTSMTGLGVFYPDGSPTQQVGVRIDIVVQPTIKGTREGRDEVLEKALEILQK